MNELMALIVLTVSFYMLYNTSKRAGLRRDIFSTWLQQHMLFSKITGLILLFVSFSTLIATEGLGVGIFIGFLALMTFGSLIILLVPLKSKNN